MDDTIELLKECSNGCKMALNSMNQVLEDMPEDDLKHVIEMSKQQHEELDAEVARELADVGLCEEEPDTMEAAFSWMTGKMKLMLRDDQSQVAKMMMDGCNMGIQNITEAANHCNKASVESQNLAQKLVGVEEVFTEELKSYL